jgi:hypothetical protein
MLYQLSHVRMSLRISAVRGELYPSRSTGFKPGGPRRVRPAPGPASGSMGAVTGTAPLPPLGPPDPLRPSAAEWLAGQAAGPVDLAVLGVPTFATSRPRTGAHATPRAVRRALGDFSTWSAVRGIDLAALTVADLGDIADPDLEVDGEWRTMHAVSSACASADLTLILGGDGAVTAPAALGMAGDDLTSAGLVSLDAHHDLADGRSGLRGRCRAGCPRGSCSPPSTPPLPTPSSGRWT